MANPNNWLGKELKRLEQGGSAEFVDQVKRNKDKSVKAFKVFFENLGTEVDETKEASKIFLKFARDGKISKEEEKELRTQVYDIFKAVGIGIPFALIPGSTLLMPFLVRLAKKRGIDLLPTAFNQEEEKTEESDQDGSSDRSSDSLTKDGASPDGETTDP